MRPTAPLPLYLLFILFSFVSEADSISSAPSRLVKRPYDIHEYFVIEHDPDSGIPLANVLERLDLELIEQVGELKNHWLLRRPKDAVVKRSELKREDLRLLGVQQLAHQIPRLRTKRAPPPPIDWSKMSADAVAKLENISDPIFGDQWHLVNNEFPQHMHNVAPLWDMGITGEGVISSIIDDGLDFESDDLAANFDAANSYDFNLHVDLPKPMLFDDHHGTRCAGQIAAVKNNVCGVGIAYDSKVAGVRILSGPISDVDEAAALNYGFQNVSIYSCSWGPADNGEAMEGPSYLIQKAVVNGIQNGRGGKGSIFVFASGNGAALGDQCNFDGYTNSIYSVTVAAVDYKGLHPYYSESCAANMVVAYSSGSGKHIVTTDVGKDKCSHTHGGTSAAAPNAVGIFALALSLRPDLTWRDIQHLCVRTAKMINQDDPDWEDTAAGRRYSYKYGYGSLDALAYVQAARDWEPVKPQAWIHMPPVQLNNGTMTADQRMEGGETISATSVFSKISVSEQLLRESNFESLEHITVRVWIRHTRRGDVEVELVSPNGIKSVLGGRRRNDIDPTGYPGWTFMTIKHWDENPVGDWTIRISDQGAEGQNGSFLGWTMSLWGSVIESSKAKTFVLADPDVPFPFPLEVDESLPPTGTSTKSRVLPKPTEHLPGDHGTAEGEAHKPAFSQSQPVPTSAPTTTESFTPDEGWFPSMYNLVKNSKWVWGAIGTVAFCGLAGGGYFLWRIRAARRSQYRAVAGDEVPMDYVDGRTGRPTGTKGLYDAFGEISDDEFADEEMGLRQPLSQGETGFHSGFLDDDDHSSVRGQQPYSDEVTETERQPAHGLGSEANGEGSRTPPSVDGSWEDAVAP